MRNWRIISTIAAVVLAAIAGVLVWKYVTSADSRAEHDKGLVPALVAKTRIARGTVFDTALTENLFETKKIPRDALPPDRIIPAAGKDRDKKLLALYKGRVASSEIFTGVPIVSDQFVVSSQLESTVAGSITKGNQAITVSLDNTHAVGGFVAPGDHVSMMLNLTIKDQTSQTGSGVKTSAFLLPNLKVLAVGSTTVVPQTPTTNANGTNGTTPTTKPQNQQTGLITFQVTPRQALQIVQASALGEMYLSLNPPNFTSGRFKDPGEIVEAVNLFDQPLPLVQQVLNTIKNAPK